MRTQAFRGPGQDLRALGPSSARISALGACVGTKGEAYHSHLLLEVIQVPALFGALALLGRALVIFLVLRGGDTIAVRATRLRARRGYKGDTGPLGPHPGLLSVHICALGRGWLWESLCVCWGSPTPPCLCPASLGGCLSGPWVSSLLIVFVISGSLSSRVSVWVSLCFSLSLSLILGLSLCLSLLQSLCVISLSASKSPSTCLYIILSVPYNVCLHLQNDLSLRLAEFLSGFPSPGRCVAGSQTVSECLYFLPRGLSPSLRAGSLSGTLGVSLPLRLSHFNRLVCPSLVVSLCDLSACLSLSSLSGHLCPSSSESPGLCDSPHLLYVSQSLSVKGLR